MEELLKKWKAKYDQLYKKLPSSSIGYTDLNWQNDGRITELNSCIVELQYVMMKADGAHVIGEMKMPKDIYDSMLSDIEGYESEEQHEERKRLAPNVKDTLRKHH